MPRSKRRNTVPSTDTFARHMLHLAYGSVSRMRGGVRYSLIMVSMHVCLELVHRFANL